MSDELANTGKILIYQNEKGDTKIDVYFEEDTIWMTQKAMCELYQVAKSSVSEHISNFIVHAALLRQAFAHCAVIKDARRIHRHERGLLAEHRNAPAAGHGENAALGLKGGDGLKIAGGDLPGHIRQRMVKVTGKQDVGKSTHAVHP